MISSHKEGNRRTDKRLSARAAQTGGRRCRATAASEFAMMSPQVDSQAGRKTGRRRGTFTSEQAGCCARPNNSLLSATVISSLFVTDTGSTVTAAPAAHKRTAGTREPFERAVGSCNRIHSTIWRRRLKRASGYVLSGSRILVASAQSNGAPSTARSIPVTVQRRYSSLCNYLVGATRASVSWSAS